MSSIRNLDVFGIGLRLRKFSTLVVASLVVVVAALCLLAQEALAQDVKPQVDLLDRREVRVITTPDQKTFRYKIEYYINRHGENAVEVSLIEAHWLAKETSLVVLRGRDTNADHIIDAWFYSEGAIVKSFRRTATSSDVWPTARAIVLEFSLNEPRWLATLIGKELLQNLFMTVQGEIDTAKEFERTQIDLLDLDYKISDLKESGKDPYLLKELQRVSKDGWSQLLYRWTTSQIEERHNRIMGDVALFVGNGIIFRGIKFLAVKALNGSTVSSMKAYFKTAIEEQKVWKKGLINKTTINAEEETSAKVGLNYLAKGAEISGSIGTNKMVRFTSESEALQWVSRRAIFSRALMRIGSSLRDLSTSIWDRKGYIATAQTVQLAVESYARGYWSFSSAPLVLDHPVQSSRDFINQVANDKGLLQNLSYMTLQTSLLSGASEALSRKGAGLATKYAICSMITLVDSTSVNILVQGKSDISRVSFDTAWEILIGGSQVHLDIKMLRWTNDLAEKFKNPKLKLVGYLLGSIDQGLGYAAYNKASTNLFEKKEEIRSSPNDQLPPVAVIPVLAPFVP
ncbi:MAG: hypothetical protein RJB66_222 [Pseudomonadota bacterium]|jgi:hypothetical protein